MEPIHIFNKELPICKNSIFVANMAEKNEVEGLSLKNQKNMLLQAYLLIKTLILLWLW